MMYGTAIVHLTKRCCPLCSTIKVNEMLEMEQQLVGEGGNVGSTHEMITAAANFE